MRKPRVLLIYPPNQLMPIETPRPDGSLGLLYLAGALREMGIEADLIDATVGTPEDRLEDTFYRNEPLPNGLVRIGMSSKRLEEVIRQGKYDIVCINSNFTPQTNMAFEVARIVRKVDWYTLVVAGGINARNMWQKFMSTGLFDLICMTEGEKIIKDIAHRWTDSLGFLGIPGTICWYNHRTYVFPAKPDTISTNLDELPFPAWDKLPFEIDGVAIKVNDFY